MSAKRKLPDYSEVFICTLKYFIDVRSLKENITTTIQLDDARCAAFGMEYSIWKKGLSKYIDHIL